MIHETRDEMIRFVTESNKIEGIISEPVSAELIEYRRFIELKTVGLGDIMEFVSVYQPDAKLRSLPHLNVIVGNHVPRQGGMGVVYELENILEMVKNGEPPYTIHQLYERLHPFTDGNGRSGRMLWKWQMIHQRNTRAPLGFLHTLYGKPYWLGKTLKSCHHQLTNSSDIKNIDHPCPKPLAAWQWLVDYVAAPHDIVLDPFMGSGTTGVACHNLGRKFIGIEIEPKYFDMACRRIEEAQKQSDLFR